MKTMFIAICLFAFISEGAAQKVDMEVMKDRIIDKVNDFQCQLEILANGDNLQTTRKSAAESAKKLFMGLGGRYTYTMNYVNYTDTSHMETVNVNYPWIKYHKPVKIYLDKMSVTSYETHIEATKEVSVDNPRKLSDGRYQATTHIGQKFTRIRDGKITYIDYTWKDIVVFIETYEDEFGVEYIIRLEDCNVASVSKDPIPYNLQGNE